MATHCGQLPISQRQSGPTAFVIVHPEHRTQPGGRHRRPALAAGLPVVLALIVMASPLVAGASTSAPLENSEIRSLETELRVWQRCQWVALVFPNWTCSAPTDPERPTAVLSQALRSLSGLEAIASWQRETGQRDRALSACLGITSFEITRTLRTRTRHHTAAPHRIRPARKNRLRRLSRKRDWVSRFCDDVPVPEWLDSHATLGKSGLCRYAIDAAGHLRGEAFSDCVRTLAGNWIASAGIGPQLPRPNIIVVLADDQRWDTIDATHSPMPELGLPAMPATWSRLAREGITFTQAIVTTPVCGPSRGSFFSGNYAWRHGMTGNSGADGPIRFSHADTWATRLDDAGYRTGFVGKYMNGFKVFERQGLFPPYVPPGWDDFKVFDHRQDVPQTGFRMAENGEIVSYEGGETPYTTDVLAAHALDFIDAAAASPTEEPFAIWISPSTPHHPWEQAARHRGAFDGLELERYPNFAEADVSDKPAWIQSRDPRDDPDALVIARRFRINQLEMQLSTDEMVAALIDRLEAHGIADDTIIVYTSDNGHGWGEHRWYSKACPWDVCLRVPMLIHYPRLVPGPRIEPGLVANIDLVPTLLALAGVEAPDGLDGIDLSSAIEGSEQVPDRDLLIETYAGINLTWAGVRSERFKYVAYRSGEQALYDLERDPWELDNFIEEPQYAEALQGLKRRLDELWPGFEQVLP